MTIKKIVETTMIWVIALVWIILFSTIILPILIVLSFFGWLYLGIVATIKGIRGG